MKQQQLGARSIHSL